MAPGDTTVGSTPHKENPWYNPCSFDFSMEDFMPPLKPGVPANPDRTGMKAVHAGTDYLTPNSPW